MWETESLLVPVSVCTGTASVKGNLAMSTSWIQQFYSQEFISQIYLHICMRVWITTFVATFKNTYSKGLRSAPPIEAWLNNSRTVYTVEYYTAMNRRWHFLCTTGK